MKTISFDISSSTIGYAIFDCEKLIKYGFIDLSRIECIFDKAECFKQMFCLDEADEIIIEDNLKSFTYGKTTANTIILLSKMNAIISYCLFDRFQLKPIYYNVSEARKLIGLKFNNKNKLPRKQQTFNFIKQKFDNMLLFSYNKNDSLDKKSLDITDAIAVGLCHLKCFEKSI